MRKYGIALIVIACVAKIEGMNFFVQFQNQIQNKNAEISLFDHKNAYAKTEQTVDSKVTSSSDNDDGRADNISTISDVIERAKKGDAESLFWLFHDIYNGQFMLWTDSASIELWNEHLQSINSFEVFAVLLGAAIEQNNIDFYNMLIRHILHRYNQNDLANIINTQDEQGYALAHYAAQNSTAFGTEVMRFLIRNGANLSLQEEMQQTPLMLAIRYNVPTDTVRILVDAMDATNINLTNNSENSAFDLAILHANFENVQLLSNNPYTIIDPNKIIQIILKSRLDDITVLEYLIGEAKISMQDLGTNMVISDLDALPIVHALLLMKKQIYTFIYDICDHPELNYSDILNGIPKYLRSPINDEHRAYLINLLLTTYKKNPIKEDFFDAETKLFLLCQSIIAGNKMAVILVMRLGTQDIGGCAQNLARQLGRLDMINIINTYSKKT